MLLLPSKDPRFAETLKSARQSTGLAQWDLAKAIGVHVRTIYSWEHGDTAPDFNNWTKLHNVLIGPNWATNPLADITLDQLLAEIERRGYDIVLSSKKPVEQATALTFSKGDV